MKYVVDGTWMSAREVKSGMTFFLTGALGLIGQQVLLELLNAGHNAVALIRSKQNSNAASRFRQAMRNVQLPDDWRQRITLVDAALLEADSAILQALEGCDAVVHCAASLVFCKGAGSAEPYRTNVDGTKWLAKLATQAGVSRFVFVSTAYVCGQTDGPASEQVGEYGVARNDYEASKQQAETWLASQADLDWVILRPGIVVGHSVTGCTRNYFGVYRILKSVARLSKHVAPDRFQRRHLPLRLPYSGTAQKNLIAVDDVARAIAAVAENTQIKHECLHLVPSVPVEISELGQAVRDFYQLDGIEFAGKHAKKRTRNPFERILDRDGRILGDYFDDDPVFLTDNRDRLLPNYKTSVVDAALIKRLLRFAEAEDWGAAEPHAAANSEVHRCTDAEDSGGVAQHAGAGVAGNVTAAVRNDLDDFFLQHFRQASDQSDIEPIPGLTTTVLFRVSGVQSGAWLCHMLDGRVSDIEAVQASETSADFEYRADATAFWQIVSGRLSVQDAFFDRRVEISGNVERAMLLAGLFEELLQQHPYEPPCVETSHISSRKAR